MEQLTKDDKTGVRFTAEEYEVVRQWVQDRAAQEIIATPGRLYLPVGEQAMTTIGEGDLIWWAGGLYPNNFQVERAPVLP